MNRQAIYRLIDNERNRQDQKWGADRDLPMDVWLNVLCEEFLEAFHGYKANVPPPHDVCSELVQVAAVAVAALERYGGEND